MILYVLRPSRSTEVRFSLILFRIGAICFGVEVICFGVGTIYFFLIIVIGKMPPIICKLISSLCCLYESFACCLKIQHNCLPRAASFTPKIHDLNAFKTRPGEWRKPCLVNVESSINKFLHPAYMTRSSSGIESIAFQILYVQFVKHRVCKCVKPAASGRDGG